MRIDLPNPDRFKQFFDITMSEPLVEKVIGISTDSRDIKEGDLYIAIAGEKVDGHSFLTDVFDKGASSALVRKPVDKSRKKQIIIDDPIYAIGKLARAWRDQFQSRLMQIFT